uniref:NADH-ubiquinone oxidoreductase chain 4 n=1 Tax=Lepidogalaxias salamandroides TaxID=89578 RepID=F1AWF9_9TELE|nr:NADH dehydrogenase subunit 4 [Lepidogalaxias salamandroides]
MLKILIPTILLLPSIWLSPPKWLWTSTLSNSMMIAIISLILLKWPSETAWTNSNLFMATDPLSTPLLSLTCWILPLMILASQHHILLEPKIQQRTYLTLMTLLQIFLIMAFSATELLMFYIMFEATLIPTLFIITRWGNQAERLNAGTYFLFYTLASSLPLLTALLLLQKDTGTLSILMVNLNQPFLIQSWGDKIWWAACLLAFLVKMPLYSLHLWLPKAHVEAPIAGSMVLAAILLKLGGYGMMRISATFYLPENVLIYPFMALALWGVIMTGLICLRQTDLKSLIAYSSVGHMSMVAAAILIQTPWSFAGATILMIAHGLTSSALFCLANTSYERTHSRTMMLARGTQITLNLMSAWWLVATLANLALPPLPNLMGELMIIMSLFNWSYWTLIMTGAGTLITVAYSLYLFITTQQGPTPNNINSITPSFTREHLLMSLHLIPLILLILKPQLISGWTL